jgi:hypothetical protein
LQLADQLAHAVVSMRTRSSSAEVVPPGDILKALEKLESTLER